MRIQLYLSNDCSDETRFNTLFRSILNEFTCITSSKSFTPLVLYSIIVWIRDFGFTLCFPKGKEYSSFEKSKKVLFHLTFAMTPDGSSKVCVAVMSCLLKTSIVILGF